MRLRATVAALLLLLSACKKKEEAQNPAALPQNFFAAVRKGDLAGIKEGLGADAALARAKDSSGQWTALHLAPSPEVAAALLDAGAELEAPGPSRMTPLHAAVKDDRQEVAKLLLTRKASLQARMQDPPFTPLQLAVAQRRAELTAYLLELSSPQELSERIAGDSLLHLAVRAGDSVIAELLLLKGMDPNVVDERGRTPIFLSTYTAMADLLLDKGASPAVLTAERGTLVAELLKSTAPAVAEHVLKRKPALDADNVGRSLIAAADYNADRVMRLLLERQPEFRYKRAAIFRAAWLGYARPVDLLGGEGAAQAQDERGRTPLHFATTPEVVAALKAHGTYIDARDDRSQTPLLVAAAAGRDLVAMALLHEGAEPGPASPDGDTPLHFATARDSLGLVDALLGRGAEPNVSNKLGVTPLHYVAFLGNLDLARRLLEKGADPLAKIKARVKIGSGPVGSSMNPLAGQDVAGKTPYDLTPFPLMKTLLKAHFPKED
ncbi:MAG: ankyrin repeat domain-containing protein [Elusimicrobia bacterium]|nr:ankyrin repeat domain-containing protein [Elusimicrobiota bacterium]